MSIKLKPSLPQGFVLIADRSITPEEILDVRQEPITQDNIDIWRKCIEQSLLVVGVREQETKQLVGVGMLVGNQRHAELVDGTVHPDFRRRGIGRVLLAQRIQFARDNNIRYVGLTYNEKSPWLKSYYASNGFKPIDFAMWLSDSLEEK
jgi:GNAT superfamily N-acetyltransferase